MGIDMSGFKAKSTNKKLIPPEAFQPAKLILAAAKVYTGKMTRADAVLELVNNSPDLQAKYGVKVDDYKKPGQTMSGIWKRSDKLVETDPEMYDLGIKYGLKISTPRPVIYTYPPNPNAIDPNALDPANAVTAPPGTIEEVESLLGQE